MTGSESAPVTSTSPLLEVAAAIEPDPHGWIDAMNGSDALVSNDVKSVFSTGTEGTPCARRRCRRKKRAGAVCALPQDVVDGTATTGVSAVNETTSLLVKMADLDSEELDRSLPSLIAEQTEDFAMMAASTNRPSTEETLPQSAAVKS